HGLGHFYAGADSMGWFLLGTGAVGAGLIGLGATIEDKELARLPIWWGVILFELSWIVDIGMAPGAVKEHNKRVLEQQKREFGFQLHQRNDQLGFWIVKGL
ncbi:MAG: hypothetical protein JSV10_09690, partial [Candidatus Zixiibacteriota bacterium]